MLLTADKSALEMSRALFLHQWHTIVSILGKLSRRTGLFKQAASMLFCSKSVTGL